MYNRKSNFPSGARSQKSKLISQKGQSLIELVVVIAVILIVVGALVFATIASLRNASFAKNQTQSTKLAQEGLEKIRSLRDRDTASSINYNDGTHTASKFSELWVVSLSCSNVPPTCPSTLSTCPVGNCYFYFNSTNTILTGNATASNLENIVPDNFRRQFFIEDYVDGTKQKKVTSVVSWTDFSGPHESRLTTILSNPNSQ